MTLLTYCRRDNILGNQHAALFSVARLCPCCSWYLMLIIMKMMIRWLLWMMVICYNNANHNSCSCWAPLQLRGRGGTHTRSADHKVSFLMHVVVINNYVLFVSSTCFILVVGFCLVALCKVLLGALDGNSNVEALCFGILKGQVFLQTEVYSHFIPPHRRRNILLYYVMPVLISYLTWWSWHWFGIRPFKLKVRIRLSF